MNNRQHYFSASPNSVSRSLIGGFVVAAFMTAAAWALNTPQIGVLTNSARDQLQIASWNGQ